MNNLISIDTKELLEGVQHEKNNIWTRNHAGSQSCEIVNTA